MSGRRIFFAGNLRAGGNEADWIGSLRQMGYDVRPFRIFPYRLAGSRLERSIASRVNIGRAIWRLNADLRLAAREVPFDFAIVVKGNWVYPETVRALARAASTDVVVHLAVDSMFHANRSRHFFQSIPEYAALITDKLFEEEHYRRAGARNVLHFIQGYGARFAASDPSKAVARTDLCFLGHREPHYVRRLRALATLDADLGIWGPGWSKRKQAPWEARAIRGNGLWGRTYPDTMAAAKIGLGFLSKRVPDQATTRSVEIPATGAMLLAERTLTHQSLFEEGVEADFFSNDDEMLEKTDFYLRNDTLRRRISEAGLARCRYSRYDMFFRLKNIFSELAHLLSIKGPH